MVTSNNVYFFPNSKISMTGVSIVAAIAVSGFVYWFQQRIKKSNLYKLPTKWKPVGKIQQLFIYPLKSGKALEVNTAECTVLGLKEVMSSSDSNEKKKFLFLDRYFMIYQENSQKFLTARQKNFVLLISVRSSGPKSVTLIAPNCDEDITFEIEGNGKRIKCSMHHNEEIEVLDCGDEVAVWLSNVILKKKNGLRLGFYPNTDERQRSMSKKPFNNNPDFNKYMSDNDLGAFSDLASYMVLSQSSVDDLSKRVEPEKAEVTVRQFRPNIVISGNDISAYDEDIWEWMKIGENVIMNGSKPCTRCTMVNLDPDKAVPNPNSEPLITLKKYRQVTDPILKPYEGESPVFGRYFGLYNGGHVSVGDIIYVPA